MEGRPRFAKPLSYMLSNGAGPSLVAADSARRIEGNPNIAKLAKPVPDAVVKAARQAREQGRSLRAVSAALERKGMLASSGKPYGRQSSKPMLRA